MTSEEKTLLIILTGFAVLVPITLGAAVGWPVWSWLLLAVFLLCVPSRMRWNIKQRVRWEGDASLRHVDERNGPPTPVADVPLSSADSDYEFRFSATVYWRPAMRPPVRHANPGELAVDAIIARALEVTKAVDPSLVDVAQHRLAAALGVVDRRPTGAVEAWANEIQLMLPEEDEKRLRKHSELRKNQKLWEHERERECSKREYLADDVLKSPRNAVVWWLARTDDVNGTVNLMDNLTKLSNVATDVKAPAGAQVLFESADGEHPSPNGRSSSDKFGAWMASLNLHGNQPALFARGGALLVKRFGKLDEAEEIRRRFDAPSVPQQKADIPKADDEPWERHPLDEEPPLEEDPWRGFGPPGKSEEDGPP